MLLSVPVDYDWLGQNSLKVQNRVRLPMGTQLNNGEAHPLNQAGLSPEAIILSSILGYKHMSMRESLDFEDWVFTGTIPDPIYPSSDNTEDDDYEPYQSDWDDD